MSPTAFYAGSFDPVTLGHLDVIHQACGLFAKLVIAVGVHAGKTPLFSLSERVSLIEQVCSPLRSSSSTSIDVLSFSGLGIDAARQAGASHLIRGLRDGTDFDAEMQLATMNKTLASSLQTVFLPASAQTRAISATLVRQIAAMRGDVSPFVPACVAEALLSRR